MTVYQWLTDIKKHGLRKVDRDMAAATLDLLPPEKPAVKS